MTDRILNVLFLCTGNSARSILAESLLNAAGKGRFMAFSAGSHPAGTVNPYVLEFLAQRGLPTEGLRSKNWEEFALPDAPKLDFVITVCDNAAGEVCPIWPGRPATVHWGFPDPSRVEGGDDAKRAAFDQVFVAIRRRIELLVNLPVDKLEHLALKDELKRIHAGGAA